MEYGHPDQKLTAKYHQNGPLGCPQIKKKTEHL
jgi:hypothetical protein